VNPDEITETPPKGFWMFMWEAMHDLTLTILAICAVVSLEIGTVTEDWEKGWYDGFGIAFSIVLVVLWSLLQVEEASADTLLLSACEASVKQRTKACYADQSMNPRMGQTYAFGSRVEEGC
jgi:magnesium-transporting ATPase (P-type)